MGKKVCLTINEQDVNFEIELLDFHALQNELGPDNKVAPAHAFVTRTVVHENKDALNQLINDNPGLELELMGHLVQEYKTTVAISVKKPSSTSGK